MTVERDIAGFAFPFTAGILMTSFFGTTSSYGPALLFFLLTATSVLLLMHPSHKRWDGRFLTALIIIASSGCGCMVGLTTLNSSVGVPADFSLIPEHIRELGHNMKSLIYAIPFRESNTNSVIAAMITGERTGLPQSIRMAFMKSGAAHILALSGLHLGIVYGTISYILSVAGNSPAAKKMRALFLIIACGTYTAATGAGASITRAFLFILIRETALLTGRNRNIATILMTSLFVQLLFSPGSSRDVGFQLSYAAMAGIAFISPWLKGLWPGSRGGTMRRIWDSAAISIACQVTTGPIAYLYFSTFPQYFLLTNLLALPLVGLIIPMSLIIIGINAVWNCPELLIKATEGLTQGMLFILETISSL